MNLLDARRAQARWFSYVALLVLGMMVLTACGGGSDDDSDDEPDVVQTAAPIAPTATVEPERDPTATSTSEPEATITPEPTATATSSPTPEPPTATPTITPSPTATPLPTVDNPFGESVNVTDALQNFTLTYSARFDGDDEDDGTVDLLVEQANPEAYHLRVSSSGQQTEAWRVGEVIYVLGPGGAVVELPGLVDQNLYAPSSFLFLVPDLRSVGVATVIEENVDVGGRATTHYEIDPAAAGAFRPDGDDSGNVDGTFDVWVDTQTNIILQMRADVEWELGASTQSLQMDFLISAIDSTPEPQPPL